MSVVRLTAEEVASAIQSEKKQRVWAIGNGPVPRERCGTVSDGLVCRIYGYVQEAQINKNPEHDPEVLWITDRWIKRWSLMIPF